MFSTGFFSGNELWYKKREINHLLDFLQKLNQSRGIQFIAFYATVSEEEIDSVFY